MLSIPQHPPRKYPSGNTIKNTECPLGNTIRTEIKSLLHRGCTIYISLLIPFSPTLLHLFASFKRKMAIYVFSVFKCWWSFSLFSKGFISLKALVSYSLPIILASFSYSYHLSLHGVCSFLHPLSSYPILLSSSCNVM